MTACFIESSSLDFPPVLLVDPIFRAFHHTMMFCVILPLVTLIIGSAEAERCFECASPGLKDNWHLIGYPNKLDDRLFLFDCDRADVSADTPPVITPRGANVNSDCKSFCVTFAMQALDGKGQIKTSEFWVLRGCYDTLMQGSTESPANRRQGATNELMERGTMTTFDVEYNEQKVSVGLHSCIATATATKPCNLLTPSAILTCDPSTDTCTIPSTTKICREEPGKTWSCNYGAYCTKFDTWVLGQRIIARGCSSINPFIPPNTEYTYSTTSGGAAGGDTGSLCVRYEGQTYAAPAGRSDTSSLVCYCNDQTQCNGSNRIGSSTLALRALLMALIGGITRAVIAWK